MRIAITGGTGFVGRHLVRRLSSEGHEIIVISRGRDTRDSTVLQELSIRSTFIGLDDPGALEKTFLGCDAVAHCAGINRELGVQTYQRVHVDGTRHVLQAAEKAGVKKVAFLSFLRARSGCGSPYHESKWAAEEIIRGSKLDYTILKAGVIYGKGDHMLDHLSHALHTFPVFALVGMKDKRMRPIAVEDLVQILRASLVEGRLTRKTVSVLGPEELTLREAVLRVASVIGKSPFMFRAPIWFHKILGHLLEAVMKTPLVSLAQVRILSEGIVDPWQPCEKLPEDLLPRVPFTIEAIRRGLPEAKRFKLSDLRGF
jgi:NADH dehydrogenase